MSELVKYPDKGPSTFHPLARSFEPPSFEPRGRQPPGLIALSYRLAWLVGIRYGGGGVWLLDKKLQVPPSL